jgi:hypothetical protein
LPEDFFNDLLVLGKVDKKSLKFSYLREHWGQAKGGKR